MKKFKLVLIEWEDSSTPPNEWTFLSDLPNAEATPCKSVGWLIHSDKRTKMLAPNLADIGSSDMSVCSIIKIPAKCVRRQITLVENAH